MPGLERWEGARFVAAADGGEQTYHRIAELYFTDQAALEAALGSAEGQATAADYGQIAPPGSRRMFIAAVDKEARLRTVVRARWPFDGAASGSPSWKIP